MATKEQREAILKQYADGEITMDQADELLRNMEMEAAGEEVPPEEFISVDQSGPEEGIPADIKPFRYYWLIPLLVGILFTLWGGFGIYNQYTNHGLSFGFWLAFVPLFLGAAIITLAVSSSKGHWIHVRVDTGQDEWPRKIAISLPLPVGLMKLGMKASGKLNIEGLGGSDLTISDFGELMNALENSDQPLIVNVDEGKEKVKVLIW